jgi:4-amino-4-deoxy-L-arabinose transferase-like glycosyltransferase
MNSTRKALFEPHRLGLAAVVVLAAILRLWDLDQNGHGNAYYAAAVRSMLTSLHNFFFSSFDPGGFVTVDKPPVALWVQTASAKLFGFSGLSLLVPQALMGVLAVVVLYLLVRRVAGTSAGLIAALCLAVTPVSVAVDRTNLLDTCLVLVLLLAAWAALRASEAGSLKVLLVSAALVGVGFNVKMLAAFVVLPTLFGVYLLGAPIPLKRRLAHMAVATVVLTAVTLSWPVAVDLTPADSRPYVGGSQDNSVMGLAFGFNGVQRILGRGAPPGRATEPAMGPGVRELPPDAPPEMRERMEQMRRGMRRIPGFGGEPGLLRLGRPHMAGQISWLLPVALIGLVFAAAGERWRPPLGPPQHSLLLWSGWFATWAVVLSLSQGIIHDYYTIMLAPAVAALVGIGGAALWRGYRDYGWRGWLLPAAVALTAAWQLKMLVDYPSWWPRLALPLVVLAGVSLVALVVLRRRPEHRPWSHVLAAASVAPLLLCPLAWSLTPVLERGAPALPMAGPPDDILRSAGIPGFPFGADPREGTESDSEKPRSSPRQRMLPGDTPVDARLVEFLLANRGDERFLVAGPSSMIIAPIIIETGMPAMALGGFGGRDQILSQEEFADRVAAGDVRFALATPRRGPGMGRRAFDAAIPAVGLPPDLLAPPIFGPRRARPRGPGMGQPEALEWVYDACQPVPRPLWRSPPEAAGSDDGQMRRPPRGLGPRMRDRFMALYDCRGELTLVSPDSVRTE